jgi:hypothetical protein
LCNPRICRRSAYTRYNFTYIYSMCFSISLRSSIRPFPSQYVWFHMLCYPLNSIDSTSSALRLYLHLHHSAQWFCSRFSQHDCSRSPLWLPPSRHSTCIRTRISIYSRLLLRFCQCQIGSLHPILQHLEWNIDTYLGDCWLVRH